LKQQWLLVSNDQYQIELQGDILTMTKPEMAEQKFDDGMLIRFPEGKP
jgi:hypothetical protein